MHARLRRYKYCYSNLGAIYAKGLCSELNFYFTIILFAFHFYRAIVDEGAVPVNCHANNRIDLV